MATKRSTTEQAQAAIKAAQETAAEWVELERLHGWEHNPKRHPDAQVADLMRSIKRFGWGAVILARPNGEIIAGHGRLEAAKRLGLAKVPVRWLNLDPTEAHLLALADNKLTEIGEWDDALVGRILTEAQAEGADLTGLGWDESELLALMAGGGESEKGSTGGEDTIPEQAPRAVSRLGETWILGPHRLTCGDSTDPRVVQRVSQGSKADICFTSPPYGLGKSIKLSGNSAANKTDSAYKDHDDDPEEWGDLMARWFAASRSIITHGWVVNVQPLDGNKRQLIQFIHDRSTHLVDVLTWDKGHAAPQMAPSVCNSAFEWIMVFSCKANATRCIPCADWRGTISSVYRGPPQRDNEFAEIHAATMPTHLPVWVVGTLCNTSKVIFDPFGGTGTTMIACHQLGRTCWSIEIDPLYVDTAVRRWQGVSGKPAVLEGDGRSFDEVSRERLGEGG